MRRLIACAIASAPPSASGAHLQSSQRSALCHCSALPLLLGGHRGVGCCSQSLWTCMVRLYRDKLADPNMRSLNFSAASYHPMSIADRKDHLSPQKFRTSLSFSGNTHMSCTSLHGFLFLIFLRLCPHSRPLVARLGVSCSIHYGFCGSISRWLLKVVKLVAFPIAVSDRLHIPLLL